MIGFPSGVRVHLALEPHDMRKSFKALFYGLGHWAGLARYLEDGRFEIDNNLAENAVRPLKLGAKTGSSSDRNMPGTTPR